MRVPVAKEDLGWAGFLAWTSAVAATALICAFLLISLTLAAGRENLPSQALFDYQRAKLTGTIGEIVFVGDSSLGNALDADLWTSLSDRPATNLALTGSYGYRGSLAMIESVLERGRPTDVVIMQTPDMVMRPISTISIPDMDPPSGIQERMERLWLETMNLDQLEDSYKYVSQWARGELPEQKSRLIENDYVKQHHQQESVPAAAHFDVNKINPAKLLVLREIADLCREERLNCIYMHGPLASPVCEKIKSYFDAVTTLIEGTGLVVAGGRSPCLSAKEIGDTPDHTAPRAKWAMTTRIMKILSPYLSVPR